MTRDTLFQTVVTGSDPALPGRSLLTSVQVPLPSPLSVPVVVRPDKRQVGSRLFEYTTGGATLLVRQRDTGRTLVAGFDRLVLANITEPEREKAAPVYTHGAAVTYTNGRTPRIYSYVGALPDDANEGASLTRWIEMYENFFRGSVAATHNDEVELYYLDQVRRGVLLTHNVERDASTPTSATLGFSMWVSDGN